MHPSIDPAALYLKHQGFVRKWVKLYAHQYKLDEDDLYSEAGLLFFKSLDRYDPDRSFLAWFKKRLLYGFLSLAQKAERERQALPRDPDAALEQVIDGRVECPPDAAPGVPPIPHPDGRRLAREALRLGRRWLLKDPYHARAELMRRQRAYRRWKYKRFGPAADAIAKYLGDKCPS